MEQEEPTSEFYKQLGGSATANLIFAVFFFVYRIFSTKCKHSKCASTSKCLTCSAQEDSVDNSKDDEAFQRQIKEQMQEMQRRFDRRLRTQRSSSIPLNDLELRSPRKHQMVKKRETEEQV